MTGTSPRFGFAAICAAAGILFSALPLQADEITEHQQRIEAQQAEERRINDMASQLNQDSGDMEDSETGGSAYAPNSFVSYPPEAWNDWVRHAQETRNRDIEARLKQDPVYQDLKKGVWTYRRSGRGEALKTCQATFWTQHGGVSFIHVGGEEEYTFLGFFGAGIPSVKQPRFVTMDLIQSGESQRVRALNLHFGSVKSMGMVLFNVHTPAILIGAVEDRQDFEIRLKGKAIAQGVWHSGRKARQEFAACLKSQGYRVQ